jgi:hypothetical protein
MSRGLLDESELRRISHDIPDLGKLQQMIGTISPDFISSAFPPESSVPESSVCIKEALHILAEARYALHEVFAHRIWYREKKEPPSEVASTFFGRFYADDAALRLYSAGEYYLANAIIMMLGITRRELRPYNQRGKSRLHVIRCFLNVQKADHPLAKVVAKLADSKEWCATIKYRNRWVHEQPPTIKGLGIVYKRGRRWKVSSTGKERMLAVGGGDVPEYSIDDLVGFIQPAMFLFSDTLTCVVKFYIELLESQGISITFSETSSTMSITII